ncbi:MULTISPECIES: TetR/AcrR family transcriptional regulator [Staphylococcus]|uniref:TetR/AcrR family transcriptional regulator n=1 Tax=Staphylococcus TaxID=1279 RepID=UPI0007DA4017|nr:TetR/AcrR family transcriptional regulator [Staphylococcus capitis]OAO25763.1 hypothetical protein AXY38_10045 [Staphylococcus capitis]OAO29135.1 hypothetical protein AXY39_06950 [Staphylococcus capitis]
MSEIQNIKIDLEMILENQKITPSKKKVLLASIDLFSKYGFNAVSTSNIAKKAKVSEAIIFKYFKNKRGLLLSIITPVIEHCIPQYESIFAENLKIENHSNLKDLVHFVVNDRLKFFKQNKEIVNILLSQILIDDEIKSLLATSLEQNHSKNASKIFKIFKQTEELASDITYISLLRIIMGQLLMYFVQIYLFKSTTLEQNHLESQIYRSLKHGEE